MNDCKYFNVGDNGQRFEIHYIHRATGEDRVFGWTTEHGKQIMLDAVNSWLSARDAYAVDRDAQNNK